MRSSKYGLGLAITAACMAFGASNAAAVTVEVTPADIGPGKEWTKPTSTNLADGKVFLETGPKLPALGTGSLEFTTTLAADKAQVASSRYLGTSLSSIKELGYSTFRDPAATDGSAIIVPALQIPVDVDGDLMNPGFTTLVYEPYVAFGNLDIRTNAWQDWDAARPGSATGGWYATGAVGTTIDCTQNGTKCSFEQLKTKLPTAKAYNIGLNQGRNNDGGLANADALYVKLDGQDQTTFDFEAEPGPTGPPGADGGDGDDGDDGTNGTNGTNGVQGPAGATGPQGAAGQQGSAGLTPSSTTSTGKVSLISKSLKVNRKTRKVVVSVSCPRANGLCEGRLNLVNKGKTIARTAFNVRGGRSGKVTVTLSKKAYKALKKSQRVRLDVFSRDLAGAASSARKTLTLKK